jgi:hypothetical protein
MLALAACCLIAALVGAPTAGAATHKAHSAATAHSAVTKKALARSIKSTRRIAVRNRAAIRKANTAITKAITDLTNAFKGGDTAIDNKINGIVTAVTPVLTLLGDNLRLVGSKLQELADGTIAGFKKVEDGFTQVQAAIRTVATSQEYGVTGVFAGATRIVTFGSADIPDDGNSVAAVGTLPVVAGTGAGGTLPGGTPLAIRSAIRSGEAGDGDATGDPAGQVAGLLSMKCAAADGQCDLDPGAGTQPVASGAVVCTVGPPPGTGPNALPYDPPGDGAPTTLPLVQIQQAADRTDQSHPDASLDTFDVNPMEDGPATGTGSAANGSCSIGDGTGNDVYELQVQTQYVDLPTSEAPDADD